MRNGRVARDLGLVQGARRENIRRDIRPTSNAAAAPKIGNPEGCFLAGARRRCSSVTERFGYAPSSRLAGRPPENSAPVPHFVIGSKSKNARRSENATQFSFSPREKAGMRGKEAS